METTLGPVNITALIQRIKLVILSPKECWQRISTESHAPKELIVQVVAPLLVVGAVCTSLGMSIFGLPTPLGTFRAPFFSSLISQLISGALYIGILLLSGAVAQKLAAFFQGSATFDRSFSWIAHAAIPGLVGGILGLYPPLTLLSLPLAVVAIYSLYQGASTMTTVSESNRLSYVASFIVSMLLIAVLTFAVFRFLGLGPVRPGNFS